MQIKECIGVQFNYKKEFRYNWIHCPIVSLMILAKLGHSSTTYSYYEEDYSLICLMDLYGGAFLENITALIPLSFYIVLLRNLQERFAVLNTHLRCQSCISEYLKWCFFYDR